MTACDRSRSGVLQRQRGLRPDAIESDRLVEPFELAVVPGIVGARPHVGHAADPDELLEVPGDEPGPVVRDDPGRGRNLAVQSHELAPVLRGWVGCYRLAEVLGVFETLDQWIRPRLRVILSRQWKRWRTRLTELRRRGLAPQRAATSVMNGRGAWWNAGARHMHEAEPGNRLCPPDWRRGGRYADPERAPFPSSDVRRVGRGGGLSRPNPPTLPRRW